MSVATTATIGAIEAAVILMKKIAQWADEGLSNDEIRKRLEDPDNVGDDLVDRIAQREQRGRDLLGRDPNP